MTNEQPEDISPYDLFIFIVTIISIGLALASFSPLFIQDQINFFKYSDLTLSIVLLIDFFNRLYKAENRLDYLRWGWIDFLGSLPSLPILRIFRILRIIRLVKQIQEIGFKNLLHSLTKKLPESTLWAGFAFVIPAILISGWWIQQVEAEACTAGSVGANICTLSDGIWWAFVTVTTVGYGDHFPVSGSGRVLAAVLMTIGVGLFGILTSYLASLFVQSDEQDVRAELLEIQTELAEIKALLKQQREEQASKT